MSISKLVAVALCGLYLVALYALLVLILSWNFTRLLDLQPFSLEAVYAHYRLPGSKFWALPFVLFFVWDAYRLLGYREDHYTSRTPQPIDAPGHYALFLLRRYSLVLFAVVWWGFVARGMPGIVGPLTVLPVFIVTGLIARRPLNSTIETAVQDFAEGIKGTAEVFNKGFR